MFVTCGSCQIGSQRRDPCKETPPRDILGTKRSFLVRSFGGRVPDVEVPRDIGQIVRPLRPATLLSKMGRSAWVARTTHAGSDTGTRSGLSIPRQLRATDRLSCQLVDCSSTPWSAGGDGTWQAPDSRDANLSWVWCASGASSRGRLQSLPPLAFLCRPDRVRVALLLGSACRIALLLLESARFACPPSC